MHYNNPREEAFLAYFNFLENGTFLSLESSPLAKEIAYGTCRRALTLEWIAKQFSKLPKKRKEKALFFTALYQYYFMEKAPLYALIDESVKIAKKHFHPRFAAFLNAFLRKVEKIELPKDLSIRYSYPPEFVEKLISQYGKEEAIKAMEAMNRPAPTMVRIRGELPEGVKRLENTSSGIVENPKLVPQLGACSEVYIQNVTPATLITFLSEGVSPKNVLDLCASPGGKILAVHDLFPEAKLVANDVSEKKLARLRENFQKYGVEAALSCSLGEEFSSPDLFDLIILDVPCSNSGVLNKRPEARWRLSSLEALQKKLVAHAKTLLAPGGEIWYLTCSILKEENEEIVKTSKIRKMRIILPNNEGWDGGFGCAIS